MKKYLVTSPYYTGAVELVYDDEHLLIIDFSNTNTNRLQREKLKQVIPVQRHALREAFAKTSVTIIEGDFDISFSMFWNAYGKKVHPSRCKPLWEKMSAADRVKAYMGIKKYNQWLRTQGDRAKLDPENYLKRRTWENEY
jgi:hypothetical protein